MSSLLAAHCWHSFGLVVHDDVGLCSGVAVLVWVNFVREHSQCSKRDEKDTSPCPVSFFQGPILLHSCGCFYIPCTLAKRLCRPPVTAFRLLSYHPRTSSPFDHLSSTS
jgi:hypothetical protein